jgi:hypothetical protein
VTSHGTKLANTETLELLRAGRTVLKLESRHHSLGREELDDVGLEGGHHEFIGLFAEHKTDEAVTAVRCSSPHAVTAAD